MLKQTLFLILSFAFNAAVGAQQPADEITREGGSPQRTLAAPKTLELTLQTRDPQTGRIVVTTEKVDPRKVGIVVIDPWNFHWCMTAAERFAAMGPRMNYALAAARKLGMQVFWAPSETSTALCGLTQRQRALSVPLVEVPKTRKLRLGIGVEVGRCMCGPGILSEGEGIQRSS